MTNDPRWLAGINLAWQWFQGDNDSASTMFDAATGAGYDGLQADGPNLNQGAESTLAMLSTMQHARRIHGLRADGPNLNQGAESTLAMLSTAQHARHVQELR